MNEQEKTLAHNRGKTCTSIKLGRIYGDEQTTLGRETYPDKLGCTNTCIA